MADLGLDGAFDDEFAHELKGLLLSDLEGFALVELHGFKEHLVFNDVDLQRDLLDLLQEGFFKCTILELFHLLEYLDPADGRVGLLPVGLAQLTSGEYDIVTTMLW